jgi:transcriptional regulator with XRE-family HTH domain
VGKIRDLRKILSENIRKNRAALHISQAKLAESADISLSHMMDIEYCKTWVSDKTLSKIARALNVEAYELLMPESPKDGGQAGRNNAAMRQTAGLINAKKRELRKKTGEAMDDLILEIVKLHGNKGAGS